MLAQHHQGATSSYKGQQAGPQEVASNMTGLAVLQ